MSKVIIRRKRPPQPTYHYQQTNRYFAQIAEGFESLAREELIQLGAQDITPGFRGLYFKADKATLYTINYSARLLIRVLAPLMTFACRDRNSLYQTGMAIDWTSIFNLEQTFGIFANVSGNDNFRHSNFASLCLKDAIVDRFRKRFGKRPNVNKSDPDLWINLHIERDRGTISLDTSGGSLHRRGYRQITVEAPMQETLAAAMVALSEWQGETPLYDPMCGSGTLLCEAMMSYCRIPAGFLRPIFGFSFLPDFDPTLWESVKNQANDMIRDLPPGILIGSDHDPMAIKAAETNCRILPNGSQIALSKTDFMQIPAIEKATILCNPPYGIRLKKQADLTGFYQEFGNFLKQRCKGSQAFLYFGNRDMLKPFKLKPTWKKPFCNGGLDGRIVRFELF